MQAQLQEEMAANERLMEEMRQQVTTARMQLEELYTKVRLMEEMRQQQVTTAWMQLEELYTKVRLGTLGWALPAR